MGQLTQQRGCGDRAGLEADLPGTADLPQLTVSSAVSHAEPEHVVCVVHGQKGKSLGDHSAACFNRCALKPGDFPESTDAEPRYKLEALPNPAGPH